MDGSVVSHVCTALIAAVVAACLVGAWSARERRALRDRLARSERRRHTRHRRALQARRQIAQLRDALARLQRHYGLGNDDAVTDDRQG